MNRKILNVTNGDYFNQYFLSQFGGEAIPFREVMMDGNTVPEIGSDAFVALRSKVLGVEEEEYRTKMQAFGLWDEAEYTEISLWFGKDLFCQVNLLTFLAYLEQIGYGGKVVLNYVDDETFHVLESDVEVTLGCYQNLYQKILVSKEKASPFGVLVPKSLDLYFDYHSDDGFLARLAKENAHKDKNSLVLCLLENSKDYGLSDLQAKKIVERYGRQ